MTFGCSFYLMQQFTFNNSKLGSRPILGNAPSLVSLWDNKCISPLK